MSNLILPRRLREGREVVGPRKQRGFIINPYALAAGGGGGSDPYIAFRKTIANFNTDLSDPYRTWTANGDAAVTGGQLVLDGTGDYLSTPSTTDYDFGAGDFCVEAFVNVAASPSSEATVLSKWFGADLSWLFGINSSRRVFFYYRTTGNFFPLGSPTVPIDTDTHIAAYRVGTSLYISTAGVVTGVASPGSAALATVVAQSCIGAQSDGATSLFTGKIKGARVTKGSSGGYGASNFTPPSFPLPTS